MRSDFTLVCFVVTYFLSHVDFTIAVTSWNMHDLCGANKDIYRTAGTLLFDSNELPVNLPGSTCKLTLSSSSTSNNMMVMFYFSQFKFYDSCYDANVTFIDGISNNDRVITGLPRYVCGNNSTLEQSGVSFTTGGANIKISFNRNQMKYRNLFTVVFVPYHLDYCSSDMDHQCSNGHCISVDYACLDSMNSCGSVDTNCDYNTTTPTTPLEDAFTIVIQGIGTTIFVVVFVGAIICFCKNSDGPSRFGGCDCFAGICEGIGKCLSGIGSCCEGCGECMGEGCSKCATCVSTGCTRCGNSLRTRCSECRSRVTQACNNCRHRLATSNNGTGDAVTSQPQSDMSNEPPPPSYEMAVQQRYQPEVPDCEASNDIRPLPSAPPRTFHSVVDEPPSYDDVISKERRTKKS